MQVYMKSLNFSALLALCAGNSPVTGKFPSQRSVTRSCNVFFDLRRKNGWVNNRKAGDLRLNRDLYDVTVLKRPPYVDCLNIWLVFYSKWIWGQLYDISTAVGYYDAARILYIQDVIFWYPD